MMDVWFIRHKNVVFRFLKSTKYRSEWFSETPLSMINVRSVINYCGIGSRSLSSTWRTRISRRWSRRIQSCEIARGGHAWEPRFCDRIVHEETRKPFPSARSKPFPTFLTCWVRFWFVKIQSFLYKRELLIFYGYTMVEYHLQRCKILCMNMIR